MKSWTVDEIIRAPANGGGFRVWRVTGVFLGATKQESVIELETLDRTQNTQGRMLVPEDLLSAVYRQSADADQAARMRRDWQETSRRAD